MDISTGNISNSENSSGSGSSTGTNIERVAMNVISQYTAPDGPCALTFDGTYIWLLSHATQELYKYNTNGILQSCISPDVSYYGGLCQNYAIQYYNGNILTTAETPASKLYKINMSTGANEGFLGITLVNSGDEFTGLTFYNGYFWATVYNYKDYEDRIYKMDTNGNHILTLSVFDHAYGIAVKDNYFWVLNYDDDTICKVDPSNGSILKICDAPGTNCAGITYDGQYFWVTDYSTDKLFKIVIIE